MSRALLFVLSAPSGAGKSTLINAIRPIFPEMLYSISCATRAPRGAEVHGRDYYFVTEEEFRSMIRDDRFLEWKEVHGNLYGTPAEPVREALRSGRSMILDIDVEGAKEVFGKVSDAVGIFISPPDASTLEQRLRGRGTDSEEVIRRRLANAVVEMEYAGDFDYLVTNDDLAAATEELAAIIRKEIGEPEESRK